MESLHYVPIELLNCAHNSAMSPNQNVEAAPDGQLNATIHMGLPTVAMVCQSTARPGSESLSLARKQGISLSWPVPFLLLDVNSNILENIGR